MIFPLFYVLRVLFRLDELMAVSASGDDAELDGPQARPAISSVQRSLPTAYRRHWISTLPIHIHALPH
jgi:hypothetical protein